MSTPHIPSVLRIPSIMVSLNYRCYGVGVPIYDTMMEHRGTRVMDDIETSGRWTPYSTYGKHPIGCLYGVSLIGTHLPLVDSSLVSFLTSNIIRTRELGT